MANEITLQDAMDVLRKQYGEGLAAGREEGREIMADTLRAGLGIAPQRAKELVHQLEEAHSMKWSERRIERGGTETGAVIAMPATTSAPAAPILADINIQGYWRF